jgi:hypothetical protein
VRSIKHECLNRVIPFGEHYLRPTLAEFVAHYHGERNHQGLDNELIDRAPAVRACRPHSPTTASGRAPQLLLSCSVMMHDSRLDGSADRRDITGCFLSSRERVNDDASIESHGERPQTLRVRE